MNELYENNVRAFVAKYVPPSPRLRVADVGSRDINGNVRHLFESAHEYIGFDLVDGLNVDRIIPPTQFWPALPAEFSIVMSNCTLAYVRWPWQWILEAVRVLVPGGLIFLNEANTHEQRGWPYDCWRFYPDGFRALFDWADVETLEAATIGVSTVGVGRTK